MTDLHSPDAFVLTYARYSGRASTARAYPAITN